MNTQTTREKLEAALVKSGLFESQAKEVMDGVVIKLKDNHISWDRPASEYPDGVYMALFIQMKPIVLEWINANKPEAWFKPMFE